MVRTQIQLTEEQSVILKRLSAENHVSMAELIRRAIDGYVERRSRSLDERRVRALSVIGCASGGPTDLSTNHDDYLAEAYAE